MDNFDEWISALDEYHREIGSPYGDGNLSEITGKKSWRDYFADGYSPREALNQDLTCANE
jgi:hypothetical protein